MKQRTLGNKDKVCVGSGFLIINLFFLKIDNVFIFLLNSFDSVVFFSMLIGFNYPLFESSFNLNLIVVVF